MEIRPIRNEKDYERALHEVEGLMDAQPDTPRGDRLDVLVTLVEAYEARHHSIESPDPIEAVLHRIDSLGLTRKDLEPLIGTRGRVSEILNRKRPMTMEMIRRIHKALQIPAEVLIQPYETEGKRA